MDMGREVETETYRQGYLQRKKGVAKSVKKRWFCLNEDAFITFKTEDDSKKRDECLNVLPLVDVQTVKKQHNTNYKYYPFEVITLQKTLIFLTDSAYEQDQWVKAFHNAMKFRSFNRQKSDVTSKSGKDRRSSTGTRKLSHIKKYMQDSIRPGQQRKSSGVECDLGETPDYQGIPIGPMDAENDDVFESNKTTSSTTKSPQTVQYVALHGDAVDGGSISNGGKSRASDDSGQGSHDVRNLDSTSSANTASSDGDVDNGAPKSFTNGTEVRGEDGRSASKLPSSTPPPVPAPASSGLSRSKKRVFEDEQIYDEPPRIDEDIYDVPPREDESEDELENDEEQENDEEYHSSGLIKSSAMINLQKILDEDSEDYDDDDIDDNGEESEYENVTGQNAEDSLEAALTEKGLEKSAVEQLKDLLESFDDL